MGSLWKCVGKEALGQSPGSLQCCGVREGTGKQVAARQAGRESGDLAAGSWVTFGKEGADQLGKMLHLGQIR